MGVNAAAIPSSRVRAETFVPEFDGGSGHVWQCSKNGL
jgi:hypothetical protein